MNASNLVQYLSQCWVREVAERTANDDVIEVYCHYLIMRTHQRAQTGMNLQAYSDTVLRYHDDDDASHGRWVIIQWWKGSVDWRDWTSNDVNSFGWRQLLQLQPNLCLFSPFSIQVIDYTSPATV